jgi:hypothetical protein
MRGRFNDLAVNPGTLSTKIFHLVVDFANNVYICWMIPKKEIACLQDLTNTKHHTFAKLMYNKNNSLPARVSHIS